MTFAPLRDDFISRKDAKFFFAPLRDDLFHAKTLSFSLRLRVMPYFPQRR
jgi:hypothetical protein